jgi:hypothetical protein
MSEATTRTGAREWIIRTLVALILLYPLSIGPAGWLTQRTEASWTTFDAVYSPLWRIAELSRTSDALRWYLEQWVTFIRL